MAALSLGMTLTLVGASILSWRDLRPQPPTWAHLAKGLARREAWFGFPLIAAGTVLQIFAVARTTNAPSDDFYATLIAWSTAGAVIAATVLGVRQVGIARQLAHLEAQRDRRALRPIIVPTAIASRPAYTPETADLIDGRKHVLGGPVPVLTEENLGGGAAIRLEFVVKRDAEVIGQTTAPVALPAGAEFHVDLTETPNIVAVRLEGSCFEIEGHRWDFCVSADGHGFAPTEADEAGGALRRGIVAVGRVVASAWRRSRRWRQSPAGR